MPEYSIPEGGLYIIDENKPRIKLSIDDFNEECKIRSALEKTINNTQTRISDIQTI